MGHQHHQFVGGALLAIVITSFPASAATDAPSDTIKPPRVLRQWTAPGGEDDRQFGYSVAINGDLVAIANGQAEDGSIEAGSVHLHSLTPRHEPSPPLLQAPKRRWPDRFGAAMSFDGESLLIGAPQDSEHGWDAGAAWLFRETDSGWGLADRLEPIRIESGARFGRSLALDGAHAVVGAPRTDAGVLDGGAAHVFTEGTSGWRHAGRLVAPDRSAADFFGDSVALKEEWIAVGAWGDDDHGEKTGSVWIYRLMDERWAAWEKLLPRMTRARDRFGWRTAFAGDQLVVSACCADESTGLVCIYDCDGEHWSLVQELRDPDGREGDWFGFALAAQDDLLLVGAPGAGGETALEGRVLIYRRTDIEWVLLGSVSDGPGEGVQPVQFGWTVATDGVHGIAGRIDDADGPSEAGRAWLIDPGTDEDGDRTSLTTGSGHPVDRLKAQ
jgi:hypothetical protein